MNIFFFQLEIECFKSIVNILSLISNQRGPGTPFNFSCQHDSIMESTGTELEKTPTRPGSMTVSIIVGTTNNPTNLIPITAMELLIKSYLNTFKQSHKIVTTIST